MNALSSVEYTGPFQKWDEQAFVRSGKKRSLELDGAAVPFPPELVPVCSHEAVTRRGPAVTYAILGKKLHSYNHFTSHLEMRAVIPACSTLALDELPFSLPRRMARDALKIAVDEADHARLAEDMTDELTRLTGISAPRAPRPAFMRELGAALEGAAPEAALLELLSFTCVSETLITGTLTQVPKDARVLEGIRLVVSDHARDEARHHAYFSELMRRMWPQLSPAQRDQAGPSFARWIRSFLLPDLHVEATWLAECGFSPEEAAQIVQETEEGYDRGRSLREACRPTIIQMRRIGMLEHSATADALAGAGLL